MIKQHIASESMENTQDHLSRGDVFHSEKIQFEAQARCPSCWSCSAFKRFFDCACVLLAMPLLVPIFALVALAVRLTSHGPVLFRQQRMGKMGQQFTILKFRTMLHIEDGVHRSVTTVENQNFTRIGPFLRRWKLDELPQLANVLLGHMSLVGPRPKMIEHSTIELNCRPGITGAATVAFAREEMVLNIVPADGIDDLYHSVVLPAKQDLDANYMARATLFTDVELLVSTVLRRWDSSYLERLVAEAIYQVGDQGSVHEVSNESSRDRCKLEPAIADRPVSALEQLSAL